MFKSLIFFARYFLFWLLYFAVDRFIFMFIFHVKLRDIPLSEKFAAYYHALRLDLSMTAYIAAIPVLVYTFWYFTNREKIAFNWVRIYNGVLIVLFSFISIINFNIYREWGSKVNARAIEFAIRTPNESLASSASSPIFLTLFVLLILLAVGFYLNFILIKRQIQFTKTPVWAKLIIAILVLGFNFLLIRGGTATAPNSQSMAFYSNYQILNHASLNTEWNLMSSILASGKVKKNPYIYLDQKQADLEVSNLYHVEKDTTISFLRTDKPNVVIFILESFTADLVKSLGGEDGVTPILDSLTKNGVSFSQIYSTGNRTDKGLIGSLTGFPTLGVGSIVKWPEKMQKIPAISQKMHQNGYQTSFYYGGESEFDNYKAFILGHQYNKLTDRNTFDKKDMNSKWGAYDGLVFNRQLTDANATKQPFFSTILSLTNHEPFELPVNYKFGSADNVQRFKSTAFYTDSCIGSYLSEAKKQPWYKNTLFIFVADHGHTLPKMDHEIYEPQRYHIPMIFYGEVIKENFRGQAFDKTGSQQDLAATLLAQLKMKSTEFIWSKNLLNPYSKHFAYFSWDNGFGFIDNGHTVTFDNVGKSVLYNSNPENAKQTNAILNSGKSYIQSAYQYFINL
ncbi:LTA synthase family protein [Pedobacter xixiisoli]|uniref:Phosphoglycerol transferase MdoB n=1 Tax=Pedobacter xixiisoli TaxID=1476464 RepID=A0A285ZST9_9SPHI|nr:alkaline phosphatase family protein [Pedobacter xixiisoli]SOD12712.1 Phosphoglycerol transferase MdoB [Pedobacter xixiisoli]